MADLHSPLSGEPEAGEDDSPQVDNILRALKPIGRYQVLHVVIVLVMGYPPSAFQLFSNVFTAKAVPHQCAGPPEGSNWTDVFGHIENFTVVQKECTLVLTDNSSVLDTASCVYGNQYQLPEDASLTSQFNLVCDMRWLAKFSQTMVILGQGVGAVLGTIFSDRFGRKAAIIWSNFGLLVCGIVIAYAPNVTVFTVFKFFVGAFQQGVALPSTTYVLELLPLEYRGNQAWMSGTCWGLSVVLFAIISSFFKNSSSSSLQMTISLVSLGAFLQAWYMDESMRWLLANGKIKEAKKVIRRMARVNGRSEDIAFQQSQHAEKIVVTIPKEKDIDVKSTRHLSLLDLLKVRRLLLNSLCLWFGWFTAALSFFTIYLTATSLSGDPYLNFGLTALMELPTNLFFFLCINRLGRKTCVRIVFTTLGTGVILAGLFKNLEKRGDVFFSTFTLLASLVAMNGASGCFTIMYSYTPEMFPTNLRSQAMGVSSFMSRMGGMMAPFAGLLAEQAVWAPGVVIGVCAFLMCVISYFVPETTGRELPQTIEQLQAWFENKDTKSRRRPIFENSTSF